MSAPDPTILLTQWRNGNRAALDELFPMVYDNRRALAGFRKTFPEGHPDEGDVLNRLVYVLVARHAPDADSIYRKATPFELSRPARGPWFVTDGYEYLAEAARRRG